METILEHADLYYRQGGSDKEYHVTLAAVDGGYVVNFTYGRRGSALRAGTKTQAPVPLEKARDLFARVVKEKTGEGYQPGEAGGAVVAPATVKPAEWLPQLLNPIEEAAALALIADPDWGLQEKHDGVNRILGLTEALEPFGINRRGEPVPLPEEVAAALRAVGSRVGRVVLPAEGMGAYAICHGLLWLKRADYRPRPFETSYGVLAQMAEHFDRATLRLSPLAVTPAEKQAQFNRLKAAGAEGVVFKRLGAAYTPGRPASGGDHLKLKFWASCSAVITRLNDKASFAVALLDPATQTWVDMGNVTCPANKPLPKVGAVVEIRYLYAYRGGKLYQPFYRDLRDDIAPAECTLAQLKYKAEPEDF